MANETGDAPTHNALESHSTSANVERNSTDGDNNEKLLNDAVKDLLSNEVRAYLRLYHLFFFLVFINLSN